MIYQLDRLTGSVAYQFAPSAYAREIAALANLGTLIANIRWERARPQPAARNAATQAAMRQYSAANYR